MKLEFKNTLHSTDGLADFFAKQGVDHSVPLFHIFFAIFSVFGIRLLLCFSCHPFRLAGVVHSFLFQNIIFVTLFFYKVILSPCIIFFINLSSY